MIDLRFLHAIIKEQEPGFLFRDSVTNWLGKQAIPAFEFIRGFYREYNQLPSLEAVDRELTSADIPIPLSKYEPQEPVDYYATVIEARGVLETCKNAFHKTNGLAESPSESSAKQARDILEEAVAKVRSAFGEARSTYSLSKERRMAREEALLKAEASSGVMGIRTPWSALDELGMGWQPADLVTILGSTGVGKTFFLILCANKTIDEGKRSLFVSFEMASGPLELRLDAVRNKLSHHDLRRGQLGHFERERYLKYLRTEPEDEKIISIRGIEHVRSLADLEAAIEATSPDIVFIDSFYKMAIPNPPKSTWERVAQIVGSLKALAGRREIPILVTGQFGRQVRPKSGKRGDVQDVSFAYALSQDSDIVIGLHQDSSMREDDTMEIQVLKMRNDETDTMLVCWDLDAMIFDAFDPEEEEEEGAD